MDRRNFLARTGFGIAALGTAGLVVEKAGAAEPATKPTTKPVAEVPPFPDAASGKMVAVTNPTETSVTILVSVNTPSTAFVEYGQVANNLDNKLGSIDQGLWSYDNRVHRMVITGLEPDTTYSYRVTLAGINFKNAYSITRGEDVVGEILQFKTLSAKAPECRFAVINDTHENASTMQALSKRIERSNADFTMWNGDVFNQITSEEQLGLQLLRFNGDGFASMIPYFINRGNHDVRGQAARELNKFIDVPEGRHYYSFRQGPVAFIVLDTGEDKPDDHPVYAGLNDFAAFRTQQAEWLAKEIEKPHIKSAPYRVLFCHIPMRWTDEKETGAWCSDGRAKWHDLIVKAGIQLAISGHTHRFVYMPPDEKFPYAQLIGGGPVLAKATFITGHADKENLTLTMIQATGEPIGEYVFKPIA